MNYHDKTRKELIKELQKLQMEHDSLKASYEKDITEDKLIGKALRESEAQYRLLFENSGEAILLTNQDGSIYSANPEACRMFGMSEDEICKAGRKGVIDLNDPRMVPALNERKKTGKFKGELNLLRKDGTIFPAEVTSNVFRDASGNERTSMIIRDISKRKQVEEELRLQSEILKNITEGINMISLSDEVIIFTNPKFDEMFGYNYGELIGKNVSIINAPTDKSPEETKQEILDILNRTGEWHGEVLNIKKNGDHFWCYANVMIFNHPVYGKVFLSVHTDITEHKQAEELIKESTERLNEAQKLAHIGVWNWKPDTDTVTWTDELYRIAGLDPMLTAPTFKEHSNIFTSESWELLKTGVEKAMETGESYQLELELIRPNGDIRHVNAFGGAKYDSKGQVNGLFGTVQDITERKHAEETLRESEELFRMVISNAPISIFATNEKGIFILHEGKALEKVGMKPGENVGVSAYDIFSELTVVEYNGEVTNGKSVLDRVLNGKSLSGFTELNGVYFDNQFAPILDIHNQVKGFIGIATDITASKKAEASLRESEAKFRSLFENSLMGISIASPAGKLLQANMAYAQMYGYKNPEEMLTEISDIKMLYANPEDRLEVLRILHEKGLMEPSEIEVVRRDGLRFFVLVSACEIRDAEGKLLYNQATHIDLTQRKKTEEKIRDASLYARNLIEASLDPFFTINIEGKIMDVNFSTEQITGIKREKLIGSDFADYFTEPAKARKGYKIVFSKGVVKNYHLTIFHTNGQKFNVLYNATLYKNEAGEVQGVFAVMRDITDLKKMEKELRNSKELLEKLNQHLQEVREEERAVISREIHDQLGQSMTALKLDLNWMQKYTNTNPEAVAKLEGMIELVSNAIKDVQRISSDLRPGILDDLGLVSAIEWYCDEFEKRTGIKCNLELDNSDYSDSQINLTFFRVLQETLTNVVRHAQASLVNVRLYQSYKGTTLILKDNGIGMSKENIETHHSLGLINMRERVRQFNGSLEITSARNKGTKLRIVIPGS